MGMMGGNDFGKAHIVLTIMYMFLIMYMSKIFEILSKNEIFGLARRDFQCCSVHSGSILEHFDLCI